MAKMNESENSWCSVSGTEQLKHHGPGVRKPGQVRTPAGQKAPAVLSGQLICLPASSAGK